ncbi:Mu transposase C-terminal domain-containing protein [Streptomyces sp. NPDC056730]|uniref:Mu transposase C-terminal domain-containing protein n=1 Tax=unclassified Streptomyces TaxID=2593676 RepID=UPI0036CE3F5C
MPLPSASLPETLPSAVLEKALWWEAHVLEVLHGLPPDAAPGTEPKPEYALALSLTARERAKAAELSAAGHKVSASTVGSQRRSYETGGVLGLADRRAARKTPKYGTVDAEVVAAMQQAISEAVDASTRNGAFLLWRTGEILKSREEAQAVELPSRHNFLASCRFLEIDVQPAHKGSPFEKGHIEKMLSSVGTLFVQFLSGFTGRNTDRRGRRLDRQPLWSLLELQELLDGWLVARWQNRRHDGLRDPSHPGRSFTPNERYAALVEACGYVPVALSGDDYSELLPAVWRAVNDYGIKIKRRTYDSPELTPFRRQDSGVRAKKGLWEIHHDPYDVSRIWVRNHFGDGEWMQAAWKHLRRVPVPFGEMAWDHAARGLPEGTEAEIADAVSDLLARAHAGPGATAKPRRTARDKRVTARTRAAGSSSDVARAQPSSAESVPPPTEDESLAEVIPLGLFDPLEDPWRRK